MIYDKCSIILVADGAAITIDNPLWLPYLVYQQEVLKTPSTLGWGVQYAKSDLVVQVGAVHHYLQLLVELNHWAEVRNFEVSVSGAMMDVDNVIPCILHLHKRLNEKILSIILLRSLGEQDKTKSAMLIYGEKISRILNEHVLGTHGDP
jgi:hypothetical protein